MTTDEAIVKLRNDPEYRQRILDSYLGEDTEAAARAFAASPEFEEVVQLVGGVQGKTVLDLGAGTGIACFAFCQRGASKVIAIEPDSSPLLGRGKLESVTKGMPVEIIDAFGEKLPLPDACVDVAYCRQVLHHTQDLGAVMREFMRVLKPGGVMLCCREHVIDDGESLKAFLANHPMHQLAGGENAFTLEFYESAVRKAGFADVRIFGPFDSIILTYPQTRTMQEFVDMPKVRLQKRLGFLGTMLAHVPGVGASLRRKWNRVRTPGRLYAFFGRKPV